MSFSLVYLANRFLYRVTEFLRHWYINAIFIISHKTTNLLERLDRRLALKITLRNWLRPLYQDYTFIGYVLGIVFRTLRIMAGIMIYLIVIAAAIAFYFVWAATPFWIIYRGIKYGA